MLGGQNDINIRLFLVELLLQEGYFGHNAHTHKCTLSPINNKFSKIDQIQKKMVLESGMRMKNHVGLPENSHILFYFSYYYERFILFITHTHTNAH